MKFSQALGGALFLCLGMFLLVLPFFVEDKELFFTWIYGIPFLALGILILINKREDKIEQIRR